MEKKNPFRISNAIKTRSLQLLTFLYSVYGLFYFDIKWIVVGLLAYVFLETFAGNIGLHRYYGHKSFQTYDFIKPFFRFFCHYLGVGSVISWVGQHRYHHKFSDTPNDVHSPKYQGIPKILFGVWTLKVERSMVADVFKDKNLVIWHRNYFKFHFLIIISYLILDYCLKLNLLFSLYTLPTLMCLISGYVLAIVSHEHGYQTYKTDDLAKNSWIANIYTLGEGWHNNHHANPERWWQGERPHEWDFPSFIIRHFLIVDSKLNKEARENASKPS